jgi:hypothetical protein
MLIVVITLWRLPIRVPAATNRKVYQNLAILNQKVVFSLVGNFRLLFFEIKVMFSPCNLCGRGCFTGRFHALDACGRKYS